VTGGRELVIQSAVSLLATGRAKDAEQAVTLALRLVDEVDKVLTRRVAASRAARGAVPARTAGAAPPARVGAKTGKATRPRKAVGTASGDSTLPATTLPIRPRRHLEKLGLIHADEEATPAELEGKLCEAHLAGAKGSSAAIAKQVGAWFKAHGAQLPKECATYDANWLTNRCDETPPE
jgi:hypothetical protein